MNARQGIGFLMLGALLIGGCGSGPRRLAPEIVRLQGELDRLHKDNRVAPNAAIELRKAEDAVARLAHDGHRLDRPLLDHGVYLADRMLQTAEAEGLARYAEQRSKELGDQRERLLLQSRGRELADARRSAGNAIVAASIAQSQAETERANALDAQRNAQDAQRDAQDAQRDASTARLELASMQAKLQDLSAKQTERGLVITLGDVLFEVDKAELRAGSARNLDQLVEALREDARTRVVIEGHTDSTGTRDYNMDLSHRRAESVQSYLTRHGIEGSRISSRGMGQDYPVADNGSDSGRLQNRRVEVIVQTPIAR